MDVIAGVVKTFSKEKISKNRGEKDCTESFFYEPKRLKHKVMGLYYHTRFCFNYS